MDPIHPIDSTGPRHPRVEPVRLLRVQRHERDAEREREQHEQQRRKQSPHEEPGPQAGPGPEDDEHRIDVRA